MSMQGTMAGVSLTEMLINDPVVITIKDSTIKQTMEFITPVDGEDFLARYAFKRNMPVIYPHVLGTSEPRFQLPLIDGNASDEALCKAFDCDDCDDTFRGHLRQAVDDVKEHVLTSLCGWRMGVFGDTLETADLTLLLTVVPGSTSQAEAIRMIGKLREVLQRQVLPQHNEQLAASVAVEVKEQTVEPATHGPVKSEPRCHPSADTKAISFQACPGSGASIGIKGTDRVGTLGAFLRVHMDGAADEYVGMTCSHVVSATPRPVVIAHDSETEPQCVVCPSDRDSFHWWRVAKGILEETPAGHPRAVRAQADRQQLISFKPSLGVTYACSGISSSFDGQWIRDWALIKFDTTRVTHPADLSNVPTEETKERFETIAQDLGRYMSWRGVDWERGAKRYLTTTELEAQEKEKNICVKVGRTTGHTVGRTHRIDPSVTIPYRLVSPGGGKEEVIEVKGKTLVVSEDVDAGPFAKKGDSGALVLNGHAQGVGTVIAMGGGTTYISPFGPALEHVKEVLGRDVGKTVTVEYV